MQADLAGFFSRLKRRGSGPRLRRAKQNRTKKLPSCSRYLIQNLPTALLLSNRTNQQQTQSHMQVQFVVGSLPCSERFFSGYSGFSLSSKTHISKFLQSWTKVLRTVLQYSYFSVISRFPLKTVNPFRNSLAVLPPPPYTTLKLGKKNTLDTRVQRCLWVREGLGLCELENTPETQKCPKTFVHNCSSKNSHFQNEAKSKKPFL